MSETRKEHVSVPKDLYLKMENELHDHQKKDRVRNSLIVQLKEKEQDLRVYKDKSHQYEKEVKRLEDRLSNFMKMQMFNPSYQQDIPTSSTTSTSSSVCPQFTLPRISKSMFDNVVRDNLKMKRLLQDALKKDGRELKSFLEAKEYEDIIKQLRLEIAHQNQEISRLNVLMSSNEQTDIIRNLQNKVQMLERSCTNLKNEKILLTKENEEEVLQGKMISRKPDQHDLDICKSAESGFSTIHSEENESEDRSRITVDSVDSKNLETDDIKQLKEDHRKTVLKLEETITGLQSELTTTNRANEQLKKQCEEYAKNCDELITSKREMEARSTQVHKGMGEIRTENTQLKKQLDQEIENNTLLSTQAALYKEDFSNESKEKCQMKRKYEEEIRRMQTQIQKLSQECFKLNDMLTEEKRKHQTVAASRVQPQFCSMAEPLKWRTQHLPSQVLVDGESTDSPEFQCPRCHRRFDDQGTFLNHTSECTEHSL